MSEQADRPYGTWKAVGLRILAVFLALWTPFFVFVAQRHYPISLSPLLFSAFCFALVSIVLGALCGHRGTIRQAIVFTVVVGLALDTHFDWYAGTLAYASSVLMLGLFCALQRHIATILATMFAVVLVSTVLVGAFERHQEVWVTDNTAAANHAAARPKGILIHLLLDEHAGIMGIPEDVPGGAGLRQELTDFFIANGFRLFGHAVSEYEATRNSVSGILNFTAGPTPYSRYESKKPYVLKENRYFDALKEAGYDIHVYQSTYMDYCRKAAALVSRCYTYFHDGTDWMKTAALSNGDKLRVLFGLYLRLSDHMVEAALKDYVALRQRLERYAVRLPELPNWGEAPAPINAAIALDRIIEDTTAGPDETAYFAHLLIPHGPYAFRSDCRLREVKGGWRGNRPPFQRENSETQRRESYIQYFEQVRCVEHKLGILFDRLRQAGRMDSATIIIHGDHGSRIHVVPPRAENIDRLRERDFRDGFATLFAVKSPTLAPGLDGETAPVSQLLAAAIGQRDLVPAREAPIQFYLEGEDDLDPWTPVTWPAGN